MKNLRIAITSILRAIVVMVTATAYYGKADIEVFTDKNSRSFKGTLMEVLGEREFRAAKIRRLNDGRIFLVPLKNLSKKSLEYVEGKSLSYMNNKSETLSAPLGIKRKDVDDLAKAPLWLKKGIHWLCVNQHNDGTWGLAGTSVLNVRRGRQVYHQPNAGSGDAGTTAVAIMALTNYLSTEKSPAARLALRKGVKKLLDLVKKGELTKRSNTRSTSVRKNTQTYPTLVERKLGPVVNTALVAQALAKLYMELPEDAQDKEKIGRALDTCLQELNKQHAQFVRPSGGWASILQTTSCLVAWEYAGLCNRKPQQTKLDELRTTLTEIFNEGMNTFDLTRSAGVNLYSFASAIRANAPTAATISAILPKEMAEQSMAESTSETVGNSYRDYSSTNSDTFVSNQIDYDSDPVFLHLDKKMERAKALQLAKAYRKNEKLLERLEHDNDLLRGFGNNGGEEYLSFYLIGQALQLSDEGMWNNWREKVVNIVKPHQNPDGSWVGQHCITDQSFCTATVILSVLTDREGSWLRKIPETELMEETSGVVSK